MDGTNPNLNITFLTSKSSASFESNALEIKGSSWLGAFQLRIDYKRSAKLEREEKARKEGAILLMVKQLMKQLMVRVLFGDASCGFRNRG